MFTSAPALTNNLAASACPPRMASRSGVLWSKSFTFTLEEPTWRRTSTKAALPVMAEVCSGVQACLSMLPAEAPPSRSVSPAASLSGSSEAQCSGVLRSCSQEQRRRLYNVRVHSDTIPTQFAKTYLSTLQVVSVLAPADNNR